MITGYQVRVMENNEEALILFVQMEEEFSLEWFEKLKTNGFRDFIKQHKIMWNGTKVFLVVGGITLAVFQYRPPQTQEVKYISDTLLAPLIVEKSQIETPVEEVSKEEKMEDVIIEEKQEEIKEQQSPSIIKKEKSSSSGSTNSNIGLKPSISNSSVTEKPSTSPPNVESSPKEEIVDTTTYVSVYRSNGTVLKLAMEEYLIGVVAAEMPASFQIEALKAQSIIARTYAMKVLERGGRLTDTVSTQRYIDQNEMRKLWGTSYLSYYQKIKNAVHSTENLVVMYQNTLIDAVYHSTSNGRTEDSKEVWGNSFPYLQSVDSSWDVHQSHFSKTISISKQEFFRIFGLTEEIYSVEILEKNKSGRISSIRVGTDIYTGVEFRTKLSLRSADFDITLNPNEVVITTRGYGHGVGLSQYGANGMAKEGYSAIHILKHYYTGVEVVSID